MTAPRLDRLLARLNPDTELAGLEYERLRRALVKFFDWRGGWPPDECADEALDRLARRLEDDTNIVDVPNYAHGIARLVLLERLRQPVVSSIDQVPEAVSVAPLPVDDGEQPLRDCFERCLADCPADGQSLMLQYYEGERQAKIANRRRLASSLDLSQNALRSRVQRLRDRLEACVEACMSRQEKNSRDIRS